MRHEKIGAQNGPYIAVAACEAYGSVITCPERPRALFSPKEPQWRSIRIPKEGATRPSSQLGLARFEMLDEPVAESASSFYFDRDAELRCGQAHQVSNSHPARLKEIASEVCGRSPKDSGGKWPRPT